MIELTLNNGIKTPTIGLGTFRSAENDAYNSVLHALAVGYRHVDTAEAYRNEAQVGRAIKDSGVPRQEIFLTTKLWNSHWTGESTTKALDESLKRLGTDYLDLYLVHWPGPDQRVLDVWPAMEAAVDSGKVRSIGVSNFNPRRIEMLLRAARIRPVVNQVECHPHLQAHYLNNYCRDNEIILEAYAPLNSEHIKDILDDEKLGQIAKIHGKTIPQVVLRWHVQRGILALPKSITPSRIEENFAVFDFELSEQEMMAIRRLNQAMRHFPDPDNADFGFKIAPDGWAL